MLDDLMEQTVLIHEIHKASSPIGKLLPFSELVDIDALLLLRTEAGKARSNSRIDWYAWAAYGSITLDRQQPRSFQMLNFQDNVEEILPILNVGSVEGLKAALKKRLDGKNADSLLYRRDLVSSIQIEQIGSR